MIKVTVYVIDRGRKYLYLRYIDPVDGKIHEKSSRTTNAKAAERAAGEWQSELASGGIAGSGGSVKWAVFRTEFTQNYLSHYSDSYARNVEGSLNVIEDVMRPDSLARINEKWLSRLHLLAKKRAVSSYTVKKYFQHLQTAMKWAHEQGIIKSVPKFPKQSRQSHRSGKHMKGRPITGEEFDRMLAVVDKTLALRTASKGLRKARKNYEPTASQLLNAKPAAESLRYLLRGLWLSGLRIGEALSLTWDQWADGIRVRVDDDNDVCLMIDSEDQKNRETQIYPVVDDFAEFLLETPVKQRVGFVFNVFQASGVVSRRADTVAGWVSEIGKSANVKVDEKDGVEKYASSHDIRRAFGTRWAKIVPPGLLQQLMRHSSITTTMSFYVDITAKDTISEVRRHVTKNSPAQAVDAFVKPDSE